MKTFDLKWEVKTSGGITLDAETLDEAVQTCKAALGSGISIAANLHTPHGINITVSIGKLDPTPDLIVPNSSMVRINPNGR